jgi:hypothetical protein
MDTRCVQAINRIRHFYLDVAPEAESYLSFSHYDDPEAVQDTIVPFHPPGPLQGFASTPGPVIMVNSVLTGAFASFQPSPVSESTEPNLKLATHVVQ